MFWSKRVLFEFRDKAIKTRQELDSMNSLSIRLMERHTNRAQRSGRSQRLPRQKRLWKKEKRLWNRLWKKAKIESENLTREERKRRMRQFSDNSGTGLSVRNQTERSHTHTGFYPGQTSSSNVTSRTGSACAMSRHSSQSDADQDLILVGRPGEHVESSPNLPLSRTCTDAVHNDDDHTIATVTVSADLEISQSVNDDPCLLDKKHSIGSDTVRFSSDRAEKCADTKQDEPYKYIVVDMRALSSRLVRTKAVKAEDVHHHLKVLNQTNIPCNDSAALSSATPKHSSDKKQTDDSNISDSEAATALNYYSSPQVPQELRQWTVNMLRSPQGLPRQTMITHRGLEKEWNRVATYSQFNPPEGIYILPLARAGFFLPSNQNSSEVKVECAFCAVAVLIVLFRGRDAMDVHRQQSPRCVFVQGGSVGNVSIAEASRASGARLLAEYLSVTASSQSRLLPPRAAGEVLMTDAELSPMERPAGTTILPSHEPGSRFLSGGTSRAQQQQEVRQMAAARSPTLDDSRSASSGQSVGQQPRPNTNADGTNSPATPYQTARVSPPQRTAGSNVTSGIDSATVHQTGDTAGQERAASRSTGQGSSQSNSGPAGRGTSENEQERQLVTYEELGIYAQRPKRPDMAVTQTRINTFEGWPHGATHPIAEMAEAGFYYTGHADLVRCFHCKGGLKTWESSDNAWVEHSRWFPRCPFIKLCKGQRFVTAVQNLNGRDTRPPISEEDVEREMRRLEEEERRNLGEDVVLLANVPSQTPGEDPSLGALTGLRVDADVTVASTEELAERLEDENEAMMGSTLCKVCQTSEVNVLFLPCGHLVTCAQCAPALRTCAICRQSVKGSVRVLLDEADDRSRTMDGSGENPGNNLTT